MTIFLTIIFTLLVVTLLALLFFKLSSSSAANIMKMVIDVMCYVNTYHYSKNELDRVKIGQTIFYKKCFGEKINNFIKDKTDYIFWVCYTQIFNDTLNCIPLDIIRHNNRCLAEGESRETEKFIDNYLNNMEDKYEKYASPTEIQNRIDINNVQNENDDK